MTKPPNLLFGTDDRPPPLVLATVSLQFVAIALLNLAAPVALLRLGGVTSDKQVPYLQMALLVTAGGIMFQWLRRPLGGGVFAPPAQPLAYLPACVAALQQGGVPLMSGMLVFAACVHIALSRFLPRLRPYFPPEVSGVIVVMIAMQAGMSGAGFALGNAGHETPFRPETAVLSLLVLAVLIGLTVWGRGVARLLAGLVALVVGFLAAIPAGAVGPGDWALLLSLPVVSLPHPTEIGFTFQPAFMIAFVLPAITTTMTTTGNLTTQQQLNDAGWVRPDLKAIASGVRADGFTVLLSALFGNYPATVSSNATALMSASGITSRRMAPVTAAMVATCAFFPAVTGLIAIMPGIVIGSVLMFSACFIFTSGTQIIATRLLDARRTLVVGSAVMMYLVVLTHPTAFVSPRFSSSANAVLSSALTMGVMISLTLNLLFRLGIHRRVRMMLEPGAIDHDGVETFIRDRGAAWGARRDVMARVTYAAIQSAETIADVAEVERGLVFEMAFDEFRIRADFVYQGRAIELATERPSAEEIRTSEEGHLRLAGFLLRRNADRVYSLESVGQQRLCFEFEH